MIPIPLVSVVFDTDTWVSLTTNNIIDTYNMYIRPWYRIYYIYIYGVYMGHSKMTSEKLKLRANQKQIWWPLKGPLGKVGRCRYGIGIGIGIGIESLESESESRFTKIGIGIGIDKKFLESESESIFWNRPGIAQAEMLGVYHVNYSTSLLGECST
jgi:hypothetical protein